MVFFTSIKRPANYLSKRNGDRWYKVITDNNKKTRTAGLRNLSTIFCIFFSTLLTKRNTVHFNYVLSVLELELSMGWKCTLCFFTMNFRCIFIYVHFLKACCYIESIKSWFLPFLSNLYCTSIKRPNSIKRPLFKVPRVAA